MSIVGGIPNPEVTEKGWYILINALHHAVPDVGWEFYDEVKDLALGWTER